MRAAMIIALLVAASACADDGAGDADASPIDGDAGTGPQFDTAPSTIGIVEYTGEFGGHVYTSIVGMFRDTAPAVYTEVARAGDCRLLESDTTFCVDPCDGYCVGNGTCVPFPVQQSAGRLTFSGLSSSLTIDPDAVNSYRYVESAGVTTAGTTVTVSAAGDSLGAFELSASAVPPLAVDNAPALELRGGADLVVTWTPQDAASRVRVTLNSDSAFHGLFHPAVIECDVADVGTVTVPRSLVDPFIAPSNWGCGDCAESSVERYRRDTTVVDGMTVALTLRSRVGLFLILIP